MINNRLACATALVLAATTLEAQGTITRTTPTPMPLVVVDGVVVNGQACESPMRLQVNGTQFGSIEGLNASDVENVEVLKGNVPARMYGADAKGGVIEVTTKKQRHYCLNVPSAAAMVGDDPFAQHFFPPDLIMAHQAEIGLQDNQRAAIVSELMQAQANFQQLQLKMSAEAEQLEKLVQPASVNEALTLAQVDRVLAAEREIKRAQVALLVRTKNILTPQQQQKLAGYPRVK